MLTRDERLTGIELVPWWDGSHRGCNADLLCAPECRFTPREPAPEERNVSHAKGKGTARHCGRPVRTERERRDAYKRARRAEGLCVECGSDAGGFARCQRCRAKAREYQRKSYGAAHGRQ